MERRCVRCTGLGPDRSSPQRALRLPIREEADLGFLVPLSTHLETSLLYEQTQLTSHPPLISYASSLPLETLQPEEVAWKG